MEALQQKRQLDEETCNRIRFITFMITMFARTYKMNKQQAFLYLEKYGGLDYLHKHWWALHTEDTYWSLKSLYSACYKNGGLK
jgi:hypothetical protein